MSVYKPKGSPYYHYDFVYKRVRHTASTECKTEAKAKAIETARREAVALEAARTAHGHAPTVNPSKVPILADAAGAWWIARGQYQGKPRDRDYKLLRLQRAVEMVGAGLRVTELRTDHIMDAMARRRAQPVVRGRQVTQRANGTVNNDIIGALRPVVIWACAKAGVSRPPVEWGECALDLPKPAPRKISDIKMEAVIAALPEHWRDFVRLEATYGCRVSEMFFKPEAVDVEAGTFTLADRKEGDELTLPLIPEFLAVLAARKSRAEAAGLNTVWFRQLKGGRIKALTYSGAVWAIRKALRAAGVPKAKGTHDLRRHAAMSALEQGGDLAAVQALLGHADIKSTGIYAKAQPKQVADLLVAVRAKSRNTPEVDFSADYSEAVSGG